MARAVNAALFMNVPVLTSRMRLLIKEKATLFLGRDAHHAALV